MNRPVTTSQHLLIKHLRGRIRQVETTGRNDDGSIVSSGSADVDAMLPGGGYHRGTIVQWLSEGGSSAEYLSLLVAKNAARDGGAIVVVDRDAEFFPPAARALGINLGNLIVLRGQGSEFRFAGDSEFRNPHSAFLIRPDDEDYLWAIDQSLRCSAVAAVWGSLPNFSTPLLADRWLRRFQLSAETSGCLGLFMKNKKGSGTFLARHSGGRGGQRSLAAFNSWSEIGWQLRPQHCATANTRAVRALLARCRGGIAGRAIDLEINLVTGSVQRAREQHATRRKRTSRPLPLAAQLAHPKIGRRAKRA